MEELPRGGPYGEYVSVTPEQVACWKTLREIIHDFLEESVKYDPPFQVSSLSLSYLPLLIASPSTLPFSLLSRL
jgi:hypothetical protein